VRQDSEVTRNEECSQASVQTHLARTRYCEHSHAHPSTSRVRPIACQLSTNEILQHLPSLHFHCCHFEMRPVQRPPPIFGPNDRMSRKQEDWNVQDVTMLVVEPVHRVPVDTVTKTIVTRISATSRGMRKRLSKCFKAAPSTHLPGPSCLSQDPSSTL
jgi:hypothetical protein